MSSPPDEVGRWSPGAPPDGGASPSARERRLGAEVAALRAAMGGAPLAASLGLLLDAAGADDRPSAFYVADGGAGLHHVVGMSGDAALADEGVAVLPEALARDLTAAGGTVLVERAVDDDPRAWALLARRHGYRGCRAWAIGTAEGGMVGAFAEFFADGQGPPARGAAVGDDLIRVAAVIIARHQEDRDHARAEASLGEARALQAFLLTLSDALRPLADGAAIERAAVRLLGERLAADRVFYAGIDPEGAHWWVRDGYSSGAAAPASGRLNRLPVRGAGTMFSVVDSETDPNLDVGERAAFAARGARAAIGVPLVEHGRPVAMLVIDQATPRRWTEAELALTREAAERGWAAMERARSDERIRKSEERLQLATDATGAASFIWDPDADVIESSGPLAALFGLPEGADITLASALDRFHPASVEPYKQAVADLLDPAKPDRLHQQVRIVRPDGEERWLENTARIHREGGTARVAGMVVDVTARKRAEMRLLDSEEHQRTLVAELQHRVRNITTVMRLTFARTFERAGDMDEMASHFRGRLDAMARTQAMLSRTATRSADLEDLVRDELLSVGATEETGVTLSGPEVVLDHKVAEPLGMALHELTTNALKYGALRVPGGKLAVRWHLHIGEGGGRTLRLTWEEQGVPAVPVRPSREGFGRELIEEALPYRIGAETTLEFRGGGVRCSISVPLADPSGDAAAGGLTR